MSASISPGEVSLNYCNSLTSYSRRVTRTVKIGDLYMGSDFPIRVQSMTTTDTMDTIGTVEQSIRMIERGCELVRITAPSIKEAQNLEEIKKELRNRGYNTPLVADIHFTPNAAELAARIVEKVRVNPGNYADKKKFDIIDYSDLQYEAELERIRSKFVPLINICKEYGTAMRIGTNHGSLSDRIMSRYGDTPIGMVESAMEFLRICEDEGYRNIVLSMKASNPQVMVQAYRLLVNRMDALGWNYPLHLGVTEAGDGEDGRIKSAAGIGSLLEDGLGDTVRVSLTEDPEFEIPVARNLVSRYENRRSHSVIKPGLVSEGNFSPFEYKKRTSSEVANLGGSNVPRVFADLSQNINISEFELKQLGHVYDPALDKWHMTDLGCDFVYLGANEIPFMLPNGLKAVYDFEKWVTLENRNLSYPLFSLGQYLKADEKSGVLNLVRITLNDVSEELTNLFKGDLNSVFVVETENAHAMAELRKIFLDLTELGLEQPVIIKRSFNGETGERTMLFASTDTGALFLDGFGDGIWLANNDLEPRFLNSLSFGILQASRVRISKTEYISCPSCGRTLFDLQETTAMIRKRTDHLKGIKIAIMGCIVNGPGEMADADYGYVGTGVGKITLYRNRDVVKRNVNSENAVDELIELIREDGNWREPGE